MLDVQPGDTVLDCTIGGAGHARELVKGLRGNGLFIGFDADPDALGRAHAALSEANVPVHIVHGNFRNIVSELKKLDVQETTKVLFDLGWSSYQLDSGRGFSFKKDEPLLMTFGESASGVTASVVVNTWSEQTLADIFFGFGEERYARRIARRIVEEREKRPIQTTSDLVRILYEATPHRYRNGRVHPATRTFQALRIAVNDELGALSEGLAGAWRSLAEGGRIAVISFHSIEDRIVKRAFAAWEKEGSGMRVNKKPIVPGEEETSENPRARSAKLRVIEKHSHEDKNSKNKQVHPLDFSGED